MPLIAKSALLVDGFQAFIICLCEINNNALKWL